MTKEDFIKKYYVNRNGTNSLKWDGMKDIFGQENLFPVWVADMDFKLPDNILNAGINRISQGVFGYSIVDDEYYQSVINWQKKRHNISVKKEWMRFSTGVVQSLLYLIRIFTEKEDSIIINTPVYGPIQEAIISTNRNLVDSELEVVNNDYQVNLEDFEDKIKRNKVKLFILCSPHNPVGKVWSEEELGKIMDICSKYHVKVISDEIHQDFLINASEFTSVLNIKGGKYQDNLVILNSASKTFNLATLLNSRIIIPNPSLRENYDSSISSYNHTEISVIGQEIERAAYSTGEEWFDGLLNIIRGNYKYLSNTLREALPDIFISNQQGTYLSWIDLSKYVPETKTSEFIRDKCKLATSEGESFSSRSKGFIRINLATSPQNIEYVVHRIISELDC